MVRFKNRYIVVQLNSLDKQSPVFSIKSGNLYTAIINKVQQIHGDFGVAAVRSGLAAKYCNERTRVAVIRARHGPHRMVASCLPLLSEVDKRRVNICILYTGATLRQCYRFIKRYQMKQLELLWAMIKDDPDKAAAMREALVDFRSLESLEPMTSTE